MKKIAVLMFLIVCVTISGVYAAWLYTGTSISSVDQTISHGMAAATTNQDLGVLSIGHNDVTITIDQMGDKDYRANLLIAGSVTVCFHPNPGSPADITGDDINVVASVYATGADTHMYEGKPIYESTGLTADLNWVKQSDGHFEAVVDADTLKTLVRLGDEFVLDEYNEYVAFHALEEQITVTVKFAAP